MPLQPTASHSDILIHCSKPFAADLDLDRKPPGEPARYGLAFHELIARYVEGEDSINQVVIDAAVKKWRLPPSSARDLAGHVKGSFGVLRNWLRGKNAWNLDFLKNGFKPGNHPTLVLDHKTGGIGDFSSPEENPQLRTLLLGALLAKPTKMSTEISYAVKPTGDGGKISARRIEPPTVEEHIYEELEDDEIGGTADLVHPGKARGGAIAAVLHADRRGLPVVYAAEVDQAALESHSVALWRGLSRRGDGSLTPGPWCQYCPARGICPTQTGDLLRQTSAIVAAADVPLKEFLAGDDASRLAMSAQEIGRLRPMLKQMAKLIEVADREIKQWVIEHPGVAVIQPDGKVLELVERSRRNLSMGSIIRAMGKVKGEAMIKKLEELGAIEMKTHLELHAND